MLSHVLRPVFRSFVTIRWRHLDKRRCLPRFSDYALSAFYSLKHLLRGRCDPVSALDRRGGYDIVTVVYADEIDQLRLQARSFDRFLDDEFAGDIIIVINDLRVGRVTRRVTTDVLGDYGRWRGHVRILPFYALGYRLDPANGWILQQVMKLACSLISKRQWYVVFDAKNHLVAKTTRETFFGRDGRALQHLQREGESLPVHQVMSARMFGLGDAAADLPRFVPMTPFVFHTSSVLAMIRLMERQEGVSLSDVFCDQRFLSEFLLYGAFLEKENGGLARLYSDTPPRAVTLWPGGRSLATAIAESCDDGIVCFGVHRRYLAELSPEDLLRLESFWRHHGLLGTKERIGRLRPVHSRS